jgi:ferredoxin
MRVSVDVDKCIGAGQCVRAAADIFDQGEDDGLVVLLDESPDPARLAAAQEAERLCPARAIIVSAGDTSPAETDRPGPGNG